MKHGRSSYKAGCRCADCAAAQRDYMRAYYKTEKHRATRQIYEEGRERETRTEVQKRAHNIVMHWLRSGRITRPEQCEKCGRRPGRGADGRSLIYVHFPDAASPEDHEWFCSLCIGNLRWKPRNVLGEMA